MKQSNESFYDSLVRLADERVDEWMLKILQTYGDQNIWGKPKPNLRLVKDDNNESK